MFKKVTFISLVLFGVAFSQMAGKCFAQVLDYFPLERSPNREKADRLYEYVTGMWPADPIWGDMRTVFTKITDGNDTGAQAAVDKLLADFAQNQYLPVALYETSKLYNQFGRHDQAGELRQYVIEHWPAHKYTMWALMDVARLNINSGNTESAEAAIDKLLVDFSDNEDITGAVSCIAHECLNCGRYQKGLELCQYILETLPGTKDAMWAQAGIAVANIGLGNTQAAEAATQKLIVGFPGHERLAEAVYDIAHHYNRFGRCAKARQLYQYILDTWSDSEDVTWTKIGLAQANISLGDDTAAQTVIDSLVVSLNADFAAGTDLPQRAIDGYYYAGGCYGKLGKYTKSTQCYQKVVDGCPDYEYAWNAQFMVGRNYEELRESGAISESEADTKIKTAYEQLLRKYPNCSAAKPAMDWLSRHN